MAKGKTEKIGARISRSARKTVKGMPSGLKVLLVTSLILGIALGAFACWYISGEDHFELVGQPYYTIDIGSTFTYQEEGVNAKCFGQDVSGKYVAKTNLEKDETGNYVIPTNEEGVYTITYTVDAWKFNGMFSGETIQRVRTFAVVGAGEEDGRNE